MRYLQFLKQHIEYPKLLYKWLWLVITKGSNDLKAETTAMDKAKAESQDHGSHNQSHGKATAKTLRLSRPKSL